MSGVIMSGAKDLQPELRRDAPKAYVVEHPGGPSITNIAAAHALVESGALGKVVVDLERSYTAHAKL